MSLFKTMQFSRLCRNNGKLGLAFQMALSLAGYAERAAQHSAPH